MSNPLGSPEHDVVQLLAADWVVRLQQPNVTPEELAEWQNWMRLDERHARAFEDLESFWGRFEDLRAPAAPSPASLAVDTYDGSVPVSDWQPASTAPVRGMTPRWFALAAAAVLVCVLAGSLRMMPREAPRGELARQTLETAIGENRGISLADGSYVKLGGHSRLSFSLRADVRDLVLEQGEAFFTVAKDPSRPFKVHAGNATITAVGTEFDVHRSDDRVTVAVLEGRVMVQPMGPVVPMPWLPASHPVGHAAPLSAGERTVVDQGGVKSTSSGDVTAALEWQDGRLAFEGETLRYVVQDVNRYSSKPIVIADHRIADLRVTGTLTSGNVLGWVSSLHGALGVRADIEADRIVLYKD